MYRYEGRKRAMSPLGMYIKRKREQRGWTIADLSRQSNVPYGTIRNIEQNPRPVKPQEETLRALALALEDDGDDMLLRTLAGYGIPKNGAAERNHIIDGLVTAHQGWREMLHNIAERTPEEQDHMLQVLRVYDRLPKS